MSGTNNSTETSLNASPLVPRKGVIVLVFLRCRFGSTRKREPIVGVEIFGLLIVGEDPVVFSFVIVGVGGVCGNDTYAGVGEGIGTNLVFV